MRRLGETKVRVVGVPKLAWREDREQTIQV